ncbi:putative transcriptional regulatory protein [Cyphellophora attinorum]|uniref:Putative transcriptional regulatory protein n=1 Tax=Cyphellophora attinorum TaxID=1664694 RepID=A0A0N1H2E9_9EURO|nr:putative transcriptional regulatory protein [Phialophora attinorum]KPI38806.1 putative transcriptional regulatory protein [Phialophora attinorum]
MPPKQKNIPIAPGTAEQTQTRRPTSFSNAGYRSPELPARVRTGHACDRCRELRAKCSGGHPCVKCNKDKASCHYSDRKRERNKKFLERNTVEIAALSSDKRRLVDALTAVTEESELQPARHAQLLRLLDDMKPPEDSVESSGSAQSQLSGTRSTNAPTEVSKTTSSSMDIDEGVKEFDDETRGENLVLPDVGSPDRIRELTDAVDLDYGNGMPGHAGKMANVAWLQRIKGYLSGNTPHLEFDLGDTEIDELTVPQANLSYWAEDDDLLSIDEDYVESYQLPPLQVALILTESYFAATHGAFRFVDREEILAEVQRLYASIEPTQMPTWTQRLLLALLNIMWAVAAKWLSVTHLDKRQISDHGVGTSFDHHLTFYARARGLGLDHRVLVDHPSFEMLQSMSVLGFYLLVNGSIHRAWNIIAQTIRHATALGLHLKVTDAAMSESQHKRRACVWWSLYRIEVILSEMTGRPKCLHENEMTVPSSIISTPTSLGPDHLYQPIAGFNVDSSALLNEFMGSDLDLPARTEAFSGGKVVWSNFAPMTFPISDVCFALALDLTRVSDKIGSTIYLSPADLTWADVQSSLLRLERDMAAWQQDFAEKAPSGTAIEVDPRSALELQLNFFSLQMILYRPFLCEIQIDEESRESHTLNLRCTRACVRAAVTLMDHLPDAPVPHQVALIIPWWRLLHYITQVVAVIVLEMCLNLQHMHRSEMEGLMTSLKKALYYLWAFAARAGPRAGHGVS